MFDLMSAVRGAVYQALKENVGSVPVYDDVPPNTAPPFLKLGTLDLENTSSKADQVEEITVEVVAVYRGSDRGDLLAMNHAARKALDGRSLIAEGAALHPARFLTATSSDVAPDGVTYAGLSYFLIIGEPA